MNNIKLILKINGNQGYSADQIKSDYCMTVGDLRRVLKEYDPETPVIIKNEDNKYGANFGCIIDTDEYVEEA